MCAKIDTKIWKGANVAKTLSKYSTLLGFRTNNMKMYGKEQDKQVWWPRKLGWSEFISHLNQQKQALYIIKQLPQYYGIDPAIHPEDEFSDSGCKTFHSNAGPLETDDETEAVDLNNSFPKTW